MANKKLRFVALIVVALALVCMLVACTTTTTKANYNVIIHLGDGQSDITWDRQADFPTLSREHYLEEGLYLDAEFKTATTREDLKAMWLTSDIDVYVNWTKIIYKITVHPANGEQDVIWEPAPGNKIPAFTKVGYIMDGFYFDENCTQSADFVFAEELLENKEVWVKWNECDHKAVTEWTEDQKASCTEDGHKIATCPTCAKELEDTITALGHNSDGVVTHKDANCTEDGVVGGTYCTRCGLGRADAETVIPALGHKYGAITIAWNDDYTAFIATRTCSNCTDGVEGHTQTATSTWHDVHITTTLPTCTEAGVADYIVVFDVDWIVGDQEISAIQPAEGHQYTKVNHDDTHHWKECSGCHLIDEATKVEHTYNQTIAIDEYLATSATCQAKATYYKSCECGAHGTETFESGDALGHDYGETSYSWNDDYTVCTATHACKRVGCTDEVEGHIETATATQIASNVTQVQTCENPELTTYTATFSVDWAETQTKADIQTKTALGHKTSQICKDENNHWYACVNDGCAYTTQEVAHTWDEGKQTKEPTETEQGEKTFTCTLCWQTKIEYTGYADHVHEFDTTKWESDTEYHWHPTTCGHTVKDNTSGYEKHVYGDVTYTWSSDNTKCTAVHTCKCGYSESEDATITTSVTEATCTTAEYTTYTATFKNTAFAEQTKANIETGEALGHDYGTWIVEVPATCSSTGTLGHYHCSRTGCGKDFDANHQELDSLTIAKDENAHNYGDWITEIPAKCTADGTKGHYHCSLCETDFDKQYAKLSDLTIPATNHDWGEVQYTAPHKGEDGNWVCTATRVCKHDSKEVEVLNATEANGGLTITVTQNASCEKPELSTFTVNYNIVTTTFAENKTYTNVQTADALGHKYGDWTNKVPATCSSTGTVAHKDCSVCGKHFDNEGNVIADENYTLAIDKDAHKYGEWTSNGDGTHSRKCEYNAEHKETVNCSGGIATCTEQATCSVCGEKYDTALGHNSDGVVTHKDADCINDGVVGGTYCTRCNEGKAAAEATIGALGHNSEGTIEHKDADCINDGVVGGTYCTRCNEGKEAAEAVIPAGHTYGDLIAEIPAIGKSEGTKAHYHCSVCDKDFDVDKNEVSADDLVIKVTTDAFTSEIVIADYADSNDWTNSSKHTTIENTIFTATASGSTNTGKYYTNGEDWRIYSSESGKVTIKVKEGYILTSVTIEYTVKSSPTWKYGTMQTTIGTGVRVQALENEITFSTGGSGNIQITKIIVGYDYANDEARANAVANGLSLSGNYSEDFDLPTTSVSGATITWESDNTCVTIDAENNKALVTTPAEEQEVKLTATIKCGEATATKDFTVTILVNTEQFTITVTQPTGGTVSVTIDGTDVVSGNEYDKGSVLTIIATPSTGYGLVKITVNGEKYTNSTLTLANNVAITAVFELTRTEENPYSVAEILESAYLAELTTSGNVTPNQMYVRGVVKADFTNKTTYIQGLYIIDENDSSKEFLVYSCNLTESVTAIYAGDTVVVCGYIKNYDGTIEMASKDGTYPTFIDRTAGQGTVAVATDSSDKATVSDITPSTGDNGTTFTFKVEVTDTNYTLSDVQVNGTSVKASYDETAGTYAGTIVGATAIKVITKDASSTEPTVVATFEFGDADSSKKHTDGSNVSTYSEKSQDYTLTLSSLTNVYNNAYDEKGNSCLKLGTSKKTGSFTFTAPDGVSKVKIYVAGYKATAAKFKINSGTATTGDSQCISNSGNYEAIEIDVSSTKTVKFETSGTYRCMIDKIEFYA